MSNKREKIIVDGFHKLYYDSHLFGKTWSSTSWFGVPTLKCPLDLWIYQEIVFKLKPDLIIECGTAYGGSALYLANLCDLINKGRIITIDIEKKKNLPKNKRITYLSGSSISQKIVDEVKKKISVKDKILAILDSDHHMNHVLEELRIYSPLVTKNSYMIVEDTNINGHPVLQNFGPGPMEAVTEFLRTNKEFIIDKEKEKFFMTFNHRGYLKKRG